MEQKPLTIAVVAGEPSGDRQGAALLAALREIAAPQSVEAWGIGGAWMRKAGVRLLHDCTPWGSIGIAAALWNIPSLLGALADMKRAMLQHPPDVFVAIDSGAFNVPLARWAKRRRLCPVFYYFPPGSWRREGRQKKGGLAEATDRIVTPFPWSADLLQAAGADAHFVGHPLLDLVTPTLTAETFYERFGLDPHRPLVALLPGSRQMEIAHILPALVSAAGEITRRIPGVQFALALGESAPRELVEETIRRTQSQDRHGAGVQLLMHQAGDKLASIAQQTLTPPILATNEGLTMPAPREVDENASLPEKVPLAPLVICEGLTYDVMARSDLVITKSGTSTLEAAILQKPMIVVYRGSAAMAFEWKLRKPALGVLHIGLPNILAQERLVPELIQEEATPEAIAELAVAMLLEPESLLRVKEKLTDLVQMNLGHPGGVQRAAQLLYETATERNL